MRIRRRACAALAGAALGAAALVWPGPAHAEATTAPPVHVLVTSASTEPALAAALATIDATVEHTFTRVWAGAAVLVPVDRLADLAALPEVSSVIPDSPLAVAETAVPWGVDRLDQAELPLDRTYTPRATGAGVAIYVVDTGVATHADLAGRIAPGWSAFEGPVGAADCNGHGTHLAATAAGRTLGVARAALVVPVRAMRCDGTGSAIEVMTGLDWIAASRGPATPSLVLLGMSGPAYPPLDAAVRALHAVGVPVVAAAGNDARDACAYSPGRVREALTVSATNNTDTRAFFANTGPCVDVFAPGVSIRSAGHTNPDDVAVLSGTSMAAAHAAGALALILAENRTDPAGGVRTLLATARRGGAHATGSATTDLLLAVGQPTDQDRARPEPVTEVRASATAEGVLVEWTAPAQPDGVVTGYRIGVTQGQAVVGSYTVEAATTTVRIVLRPGAGYMVTVFATGPGGESVAASSNAVAVA